MDIKGLIKSVARSPLFGNEKYGNNFDATENNTEKHKTTHYAYLIMVSSTHPENQVRIIALKFHIGTSKM